MSVEATPENRTGPSPDREEIIRVIQLYIDGFNDHDISKFRECFHENAWAAWTNPDGSLEQAPVAEFLEYWSGPGDYVWVRRILSVTQAGDVASVLLEMHPVSEPSLSWVDIHALLRIDGVWKDMNKTATHASRADWAGLGAEQSGGPSSR